MPAAKRTRKLLPIETIRLDFQRPENLLGDTVDEYVSAMRSGDKFPPITVCFDGTSYFCEDGFHRLEAARRIGRKKIKVHIRTGTLPEMQARWEASLRRLKQALKRPIKAREGN